MIINVPNAEDFTRTGSDLLNLGWSQADSLLAALNDFEHDASSENDGLGPPAIPAPKPETDEERRERQREYWSAADRALANAITIAHQGIEFLLKGRIALISPYLLIVQEPRDWPRPDENGNLDFSQFRTIDAIHLPKICEAVSEEKFPSALRNEYDRLRSLRNRVMHSVGKIDLEVAHLFSIVLRFYKFLFPSASWFVSRRRHLENSQDSVLYSSDWVESQLIREAVRLIDSLSPAACKELLGFDKSRRRYLCPYCDHESTSLYGPRAYFCQFPSREKNQAQLKCLLCPDPILVERKPCREKDCRGDVIWPDDQICLTCGEGQIQPPLPDPIVYDSSPPPAKDD